MLKHSFEDQIRVGTIDLTQERSALAATEEDMAIAEGDLGVTKKELEVLKLPS